MKTIFFIFSFSRSGSTVLGQKLNNHSKIHVINESGMFTLLGILKWKKLTPLKQGYLIWQHNKNKSQPISTEHVLKEPLSIDQFYHHIYSSSDSFLGEKTPTNLFYYHHISASFDNAKFIFLKRHPLAIANSYFNRWYQANFSDTFLIETVSVIKAYHREFSAIDKSHYIELSYEELVNDSEGCLRAISNYLGCSFEISMLQESADLFNKSPLKKYHQDVHKKLNTSHLESYKESFTPSQLDDLSYLLRNEITSLGYTYASITEPSPRLIELEKKIFRYQSKYQILFRKSVIYLKTLVSFFKFCIHHIFNR